MVVKLDRETLNNPLIKRVVEISGQNIYACYQCGYCSATCPSTDAMDVLPNEIIRRIQLGLEEVLNCEAVWVCASCLSCQAKCPKGIDIASVTEAVRLMQLRKNVDKIDLKGISEKELEELPAILLVGAFRKFTS